MEGNLLLCILFIRFVDLLLSTDVLRVVRRPSAQQAPPLLVILLSAATAYRTVE